jgi:hypothetical protein
MCRDASISVLRDRGDQTIEAPPLGLKPRIHRLGEKQIPHPLSRVRDDTLYISAQSMHHSS